jgi:hypothetical protein
MDKNTLIGLGLIGAILVTFSIINRPSEEELLKQKQKAQIEQGTTEQEKKSEKNTLPELPNGWVFKQVNGKEEKDKNGNFIITDTIRQVDSTLTGAVKVVSPKQTSKSQAVTAFFGR